MPQLERHMVQVEGATLEVFAGGAGRPVVARTHPSEVTPPPGEPGLFGEVPSFVRMYPRGVRGSSPTRAPHERTMAQTIDDLEAVRRWRGVERWVFAGSSAGGFVGQLYGLRYPDSLAGLILQACAASLHYFEDPGRVRPLRDWHKGPDGRWVYTGEQETPHGVWKKETESFDVREQLGALRVPTLILCGRHDGIVGPSSCTALHALIPGSDLVVLEHSGHNVAEADAARTYRAAVHRFLADRVKA